MKKQLFIVSRSYDLLNEFYKDERGVYTYLAGMLATLLLGLAALAVDGSGIMLDKARFIQAMDQGALSLVAENNATRENKKHADVTRQVLTAEEQYNKTEDEKFNTQQNKRNQELVQGMVKLYLRSYDRSNPNNKDLPISIEKDFDLSCEEVELPVQNQYVKKPVVCQVSGEIKRKSWLPYDNTLSFGKDVDIASGVTYGVKDRGVIIPVELMLVSDSSGSMKWNLAGQSGFPKSQWRFTALVSVVEEIENLLMPETLTADVSPYNRMAFTSFSFGSQQRDVKDLCTLPFYGKSEIKEVAFFDIIRRVDGYNYSGRATSYQDLFRSSPRQTQSTKYNDTYDRRVFAVTASPIEMMKRAGQLGDWEMMDFFFDTYYVDLAKTVQLISTFDGKARKYDTEFKNNGVCMGTKNRQILTTKAWFTQKNRGVAAALGQIDPEGGTSAATGLLIGANLLMDYNKEPEAQPNKVGTNTQRVILVLSDGEDNRPSIKTLVNTINAGTCEAIKARVDTLQDPNYKTVPTRLAFVALGYNPTGEQAAAWKRCVGEANYHLADSKEKLLAVFKQVIGVEEEVGKTSITKPTF